MRRTDDRVHTSRVVRPESRGRSGGLYSVPGTDVLDRSVKRGKCRGVDQAIELSHGSGPEPSSLRGLSPQVAFEE